MRKKRLNEILREMIGLPRPASPRPPNRNEASHPGVEITPPAPTAAAEIRPPDPVPPLVSPAARIEWLTPASPPNKPDKAAKSTAVARIEWGGSAGGTFDYATLVGVEDAYDHTPLVPGEQVAFCSRDKVAFHQATWDFLRRQNNGRCCICGQAGVIRLVTLPGTLVKPSEAQPVRPAFLGSAGNAIGRNQVEDYLNRSVSVQDYVHKVHRSQRGTYFIRFDPLEVNEPVYSGFKVVVFDEYVPRWQEAGQRIEAYEHHQVRVHGVVQVHPTWGIEILINSPRMIEIADGAKTKSS